MARPTRLVMLIIDSSNDDDQEYIYFMGSETHPSTCYIDSDESSIPSPSLRCKRLTEINIPSARVYKCYFQA